MEGYLRKVEFNQATVYYEKYGEGIPILFIHPPGLGRKVFFYQQPLANNYSLILPDFSGHGKSTSTIEGSLIRQYVMEINRILEEEAIEEVIICGYSAGGVIAQEFALSYPIKTKAIILSGGYPKVASLGLKLQYQIGMALMQKSPDQLAKILAFSHARDKSFQDELYNHIKRSNHHHWYLFYKETFHYDCTIKLDGILQPLLNIYGENAFWTNKHRSYYNQCPHHETIYINNGFHQLPTKNWQAFNHIISQFVDNYL